MKDNFPPCGIYGIRLPRTYYPKNVPEVGSNDDVVLLDSFANIQKFAKSMTIYKWTNDAMLHWGPNEIREGYAYVPWIRYTGSTFEIIENYKLHASESFLPMHWWLKDLNELETWLGKEEYSKIIVYIFAGGEK